MKTCFNHVECSPSTVLDAVLLEFLLALLHLKLFFTISIFMLSLLAFLVLLMFLNLTITMSAK